MLNDLNGEEGAQKGNGIQVTDDFEFTEEHARNTLKWLWKNNSRGIAGISAGDMEAYLSGTASLSGEQMTVALELAVSMSDAGEIAELLKDSYTRNPARVIKALAGEGSIRSEVVENLTENWRDFDGVFNSWERGTAVTTGTIYMRTDYRVLLFTEQGRPF